MSEEQVVKSALPMIFAALFLCLANLKANSVSAQTVTITPVSSGLFDVQVDGSYRDEIIHVSGRGNPDEVLLDLDDDGVFEHVIERVRNLDIYGGDGSDQIVISGSVNVRYSIRVFPGGGDDETLVVGTILASIWTSGIISVEEELPNNGSDFVFVSADIEGELGIKQIAGSDTVWVSGTSLISGVPTSWAEGFFGFVSENDSATLVVENSEIGNFRGIASSDAHTIMKFKDVSSDGFIDNGSNDADELYVIAESCDIRGGAWFYGASNVFELTMQDTVLRHVPPTNQPDLPITTYGGADRIYLDNTIFHHDLVITTDRGVDHIDIVNGSEFKGDLTIDTGVHRDFVSFDGIDNQHVVRILGDLDVTTSTHNDVADFSHVRVEGDVTLFGGYGWDRFIWNESMCLGDWSTNLFNGNDNLAVTDSRFNGRFFADGGNHTDTGNESNNLFTLIPDILGFENGNMQ